MTPDPIKLLAPVHDHGMNDNATEDNRGEGQRHGTLESGRRDGDGNFMALRSIKTSESKSMSISRCSMKMSRDRNDDLSLLKPEGKVDEEKSFPRNAALYAALLRQAVGRKKCNINWQHKEKSDGQLGFDCVNNVKMADRKSVV